MGRTVKDEDRRETRAIVFHPAIYKKLKAESEETYIPISRLIEKLLVEHWGEEK